METYDKLAKYYFERRKNKNRFDYNRDIDVPALIKMIGNAEKKTILDIGCGFGDLAEKLSKQNYKKLIGFDVSSELIKLANEQHIPKTLFEVGDMGKKLKYQSSYFDIVCSGLAIHYNKNINFLFKEVNRVLKKGGYFCFSTGHPIFNLINQTKGGLIGIKILSNDKEEIFGDYFDESSRLNDLGHLGMINLYGFTFETFIKAGLNSGFELVDYKDAKPVKSSQKYNPKVYNRTTKLPTFMVFKFKKK
ncbi:MAG: methyltransferase domain-containing protein [Candidatus Paceibacterota bacterium]|jgi:SAM-dependent methyltransferase